MSYFTLFVLEGLGSDIVNGKKVPKNLMLYMALVQNSQGQRCGGFLISQDFVLTAAHCNDIKPSTVVLGTHNLKNVTKDMRYGIAKKCIPPHFTKAANGGDIMLLKLSRKPPLNNRVQPVQLPKAANKIKDNAKCRVAGWGLTKTEGPNVDVLQFTEVPIVNLEVCKKQWKIINFDLPKNVICAGGYKVKKGFCQGDSGGPLVCGGTAVGVVSFNMRKDCDYPNVPNVYTDISKYLQWIKDVLKKKSC
uniref:Mast cell protease 1A-like n=1 Tax=Cynoglossus semilaevis TaxID=244447 RepID=A0A3P8UQV1_CYNSE